MVWQRESTVLAVMATEGLAEGCLCRACRRKSEKNYDNLASCNAKVSPLLDIRNCSSGNLLHRGACRRAIAGSRIKERTSQVSYLWLDIALHRKRIVCDSFPCERWNCRLCTFSFLTLWAFQTFDLPAIAKMVPWKIVVRALAHWDRWFILLMSNQKLEVLARPPRFFSPQLKWLEQNSDPFPKAETLKLKRLDGGIVKTFW